jgi:hypothetical protein
MNTPAALFRNSPSDVVNFGYTSLTTPEEGWTRIVMDIPGIDWLHGR